MNSIIKEALKLIGDKYRDSKIFRIIIFCLAGIILLAGVFIAYPALRQGIVELAGDINPDPIPEPAPEPVSVPDPAPVPRLSEVAYDAANKTVKGGVTGANEPGAFKIILFILTDQWYIKPDFDNGVSDLYGNGFIINAYTQEQYDNDIKASKYAVFLVPSSYAGPAHMNDFDGVNEICLDSFIDTVP